MADRSGIPLDGASTGERPPRVLAQFAFAKSRSDAIAAEAEAAKPP